MPSKIKWMMPEWMEPYRDLIGNTGGNAVEDLIYRLNHERSLAQTNIIVFAMALSVEQQVGLLTRLHDKGMI